MTPSPLVVTVWNMTETSSSTALSKMQTTLVKDLSDSKLFDKKARSIWRSDPRHLVKLASLHSLLKWLKPLAHPMTSLCSANSISSWTSKIFALEILACKLSILSLVSKLWQLSRCTQANRVRTLSSKSSAWVKTWRSSISNHRSSHSYHRPKELKISYISTRMKRTSWSTLTITGSNSTVRTWMMNRSISWSFKWLRRSDLNFKNPLTPQRLLTSLSSSYHQQRWAMNRWRRCCTIPWLRLC